jgi:hypothetical protein
LLHPLRFDRIGPRKAHQDILIPRRIPSANFQAIRRSEKDVLFLLSFQFLIQQMGKPLARIGSSLPCSNCKTVFLNTVTNSLLA